MGMKPRIFFFFFFKKKMKPKLKPKSNINKFLKIKSNININSIFVTYLLIQFYPNLYFPLLKSNQTFLFPFYFIFDSLTFALITLLAQKLKKLYGRVAQNYTPIENII